MNPFHVPQKSMHRTLRWLIRQALKSGSKTGRWLAWIFLPVWIFAVVIGALAEWVEHI